MTTDKVLEVGTEIYYTGDRANASDYGYIGQIDSSRWGTNITIQLNEGGRFVVPPTAFAPGPGRRFYTKAEWRA